jgi:hypothetical protein
METLCYFREKSVEGSHQKLKSVSFIKNDSKKLFKERVSNPHLDDTSNGLTQPLSGFM